MNRELRMVKGDTLKFQVTVNLGTSPENLTGGTIMMVAKYEPMDQAAVFYRSTEDNTGVEILDAANGVFRVTITPSCTETLPDFPVTLEYSIRYTNSGGEVYTILRGPLIVQPRVNEFAMTYSPFSGTPRFTAQVQIDPLSIPAGTFSIQSFTVQGLAVGMIVNANISTIPAGVRIIASRCPANNTLELTFVNITGSAVDIPASLCDVIGM